MSRKALPSDVLRDIFAAALRAVDPREAVKTRLATIDEMLASQQSSRLFLLSFGKAAYSMAVPVAEVFADNIERGLVITKYGHLGGAPLGKNVRCLEAGHPLPDGAGRQPR